MSIDNVKFVDTEALHLFQNKFPTCHPNSTPYIHRFALNTLLPSKGPKHFRHSPPMGLLRYHRDLIDMICSPTSLIHSEVPVSLPDGTQLLISALSSSSLMC